MTDTLERQAVIDLLNKLGDEQDTEVLAAARALHSQISATGISWEELLVPEDGEPEPEFDDPDDEDDLEDDFEEDLEEDLEDDVEDDPEEDEDEEEPQAAPPPVGNDAETLALIEKLLARPGNSDEFREELEDYKTDLADGEFEESDHRYVRALYARLAKN